MGLIRRLLRCHRGTVAIESALIFPVLVTMLLGMVEITHYLEASRKATITAQTVADLVAQQAVHDDASIADIRTAAVLMMQPLATDPDKLTMAVASVGFDAGKDLRILWQHNSGNGSVTIDPALADGLSDAGESVIIAVVQHDYESFLKYIIKEPRLLDQMSFARPRIARRIALNGSVDHNP
ncbi:TadE/TadG family type IV pilus assembly protein [Roseospira visakhapatnamensis]|uniref:Flp pilus assembly protein TadG n=1 Tax=Roseospira visakhapatnamensis TaxID=390880 RepID=A0A7W6WAC9_9PROT|nr:TadE/TadG family type IV pilus assembly protein [Roseospira visakhapatnamensis]MBB4266361.1 Flp pilus assembly protein TadG [Roseospira visakhapatnamensis]